MSDGSIAEPKVIDWEELILEAQTDPCGVESSDAFSQIYDELSGYVVTLAKHWLETHQLSEAHDFVFAAIAWELITKQLVKFDIPEDDSTGVCNAFKSWISKCASREWKRRNVDLTDTAPDPAAANHMIITMPTNNPSIENILCSDKAQSPKNADIEFMRKIVREELDKLPESMRDAILETTDIKDMGNMNARGKQGEATAIAEKYGHKLNAVTTRAYRLREKIKNRYEKERSK